MKQLFISWSGNASGGVATVLHEALRVIMPHLPVYVSKHDAQYGAAWRRELMRELENSDFGLLCLTPDNLDSKWILFEAGALTRYGKASVCSILCGGISHSALTEPLNEFQNVVYCKNSFYNLLGDINKQLNPPIKLDDLFEWQWPKIDEKINTIINSQPGRDEPKRESRDMIEETLRRVKNIEGFLFNGNGDARVSAMAQEGTASQSLEARVARLEKAVDAFMHQDNFFIAQQALRDHAVPSDLTHGAKALEEILRENVLDRRAVIYLSRIYRRISERLEKPQALDQAIEVLTRFVREKTKREQEDEDLAAAYYNRACYKNLKRELVQKGIVVSEQGISSEDYKTELFREAIEDLRMAVKLSEENAIDAMADDDFSTIRETAEFKKIVPYEPLRAPDGARMAPDTR